jgi:hypothetical protein
MCCSERGGYYLTKLESEVKGKSEITQWWVLTQKAKRRATISGRK